MRPRGSVDWETDWILSNEMKAIIVHAPVVMHPCLSCHVMAHPVLLLLRKWELRKMSRLARKRVMRVIEGATIQVRAIKLF